MTKAPLCLLLAACTGGERASTGQCPAGETCSPATPYGLHFIGDDVVGTLTGALAGPAATAIGGTQDVQLRYAPSGGDVTIALDLPYVANDDGGLGIAVARTTGSTVTVRGVASRSNYLRILDPSTNELYDRKQLDGAAIDSIALVDAGGDVVPDGDAIVWAPGDQRIGIALTGQVEEASGPIAERLVDTSLVLQLATSADRPAWDTLHVADAQVGTYSLAIAAGNFPQLVLPVTIVAGADAIAAIAPPATADATPQAVCFAATNAGRYVAGLAWSFVVDGTPTKGARNCVSVATTKTSGSVMVEASAGGQTATIAITVGASHGVGSVASPIVRPAAGERAAMQ